MKELGQQRILYLNLQNYYNSRLYLTLELVLGPKEFPIALKKIGSFFGKLKNTLSSFRREVTSVTDDIDIEKNITNSDQINKEKKENEQK